MTQQEIYLALLRAEARLQRWLQGMTHPHSPRGFALVKIDSTTTERLMHSHFRAWYLVVIKLYAVELLLLLLYVVVVHTKNKWCECFSMLDLRQLRNLDHDMSCSHHSSSNSSSSSRIMKIQTSKGDYFFSSCLRARAVVALIFLIVRAHTLSMLYNTNHIIITTPYCYASLPKDSVDAVPL